MLTINQLSHTYYTPALKAKNVGTKNNDKFLCQKNNKLAVTTLGVAAISGLTIAACLTKTSASNAFKKAGVIFKEGLAYAEQTGEKFTGSVKRNTSPFGLKKEVAKFEDGILTEILNYGFNGRELDGYFYKNGKLLYRSGIPVGNSKIKYYPWHKYDSNGNVCLHADSQAGPRESVFEKMRNLVKKEK